MSTPPPTIVPLAEDHLAELVALNNAALPAVSELDLTAARHLASLPGVHLAVVDEEGRLGAFLLTLDQGGLDYDSPNYRWFCERHGQGFLYVDRIVVDERLRSGGIGEQLYRRAVALDAGRSAVLCAEVNIRPRNDGSLRFHERLGFVAAGEQDTDGGKKRVVMLERPLTGGGWGPSGAR